MAIQLEKALFGAATDSIPGEEGISGTYLYQGTHHESPPYTPIGSDLFILSLASIEHISDRLNGIYWRRPGELGDRLRDAGARWYSDGHSGPNGEGEIFGYLFAPEKEERVLTAFLGPPYLDSNDTVEDYVDPVNLPGDSGVQAGVLLSGVKSISGFAQSPPEDHSSVSTRDEHSLEVPTPRAGDVVCSLVIVRSSFRRQPVLAAGDGQTAILDLRHDEFPISTQEGGFFGGKCAIMASLKERTGAVTTSSYSVTLGNPSPPDFFTWAHVAFALNPEPLLSDASVSILSASEIRAQVEAALSGNVRAVVLPAGTPIDGRLRDL